MIYKTYVMQLYNVLRRKLNCGFRPRYILTIVALIIATIVGSTIVVTLKAKRGISIFLSSWNEKDDIKMSIDDRNVSIIWSPWATYIKLQDIRFGTEHDYLIVKKLTLVYPLKWLYFNNGSFHVHGLKKMQLVLNKKNIYNMEYDISPRISLDKNNGSGSFQYTDNLLKFIDSDGNILSSAKSDLLLSLVESDSIYHYDFRASLTEIPGMNLKCEKCKLFGELTKLGSIQISLAGNGITNEIDQRGMGHIHTLNLNGKLLTDIHNIETNGVLRLFSIERGLKNISKREFNIDMKLKSYQKFIDDVFNILSYTKDDSQISNYELSGLYNIITKNILPFVKNNGNVPQQKDDLHINLWSNGDKITINGINSTLVLQSLL